MIFGITPDQWKPLYAKKVEHSSNQGHTRWYQTQLFLLFNAYVYMIYKEAINSRRDV